MQMHGGKDWAAITALVPGRAREDSAKADGNASTLIVTSQGERTRHSREGACVGAGASLPSTLDEFVA
jgi:hypothetical protein